MKLGVCAQILFHLPFEQALAQAAELGFEAVELAVNAGSPFVNLEAALAGDHERIARAVRAAGLDISALSNHQEGQLLLGPHGEDTNHILPRRAGGEGAPRGRAPGQDREELARRLGVTVVNGFTGCEDYSRWFPWPLEDG